MNFGPIKSNPSSALFVRKPVIQARDRTGGLTGQEEYQKNLKQLRKKDKDLPANTTKTSPRNKFCMTQSIHYNPTKVYDSLMAKVHVNKEVFGNP